ncbi:nucleotidyltransferase family protein [Lacibacterium aquatile]|uniref:Nucleotidyltransferase family protein n=1 Tax=Lacibacterium aquatile TaxID=1168082 RepID=A0ABW5E1X8_9PROT
MTPDPTAHLTDLIRDVPLLQSVLEKIESLNLPDAWLVAGSIAGIVWNHQAGQPALQGIRDLDIVYFDPQDLSADTEAALEAKFAEFPLPIDVKNQARVPLWFEAKFGVPCPPYRDTPDAIASYPTTSTTLGVRQVGKHLQICAPFGLVDLFDGVIRANGRLTTEEVYVKKTTRWVAEWPHLLVLPWSERVLPESPTVTL